VLRRFQSRFSALSVQSHPLVLFLLNALIPWNYFFVALAERDRAALSARAEGIFSELHWFDALASLALFHRYQTQTFPSFSDTFEIKNAVHPLIPAGSVVPNSFSWPQGKNLMLITGSNMAGKSTFLRTLGVNIALARMGAPVFAEAFTLPLAPLHTCIRVSDSVREGFSYFYAEALRIGEILKSARAGKILYLIDEVFKGTNNRERFIGGKTLLEELAKTDSLGFVTTHDLELSRLDGPHGGGANRIANFHFKDEIRDGRMHFTYKIQPGPCPSTNALKIMELAGIPVPPS
jgi:DNA mismatch repair ATPase MutS